MESASWLTAVIFAADWIIRIGLSLRVIMLRRAIGVSLSWLAVILLLPFAGAVIYMLVGENRFGARRARRAAEIMGPCVEWLQSLAKETHVDWPGLSAASEPLHRHAMATIGIPALPGNELRLHENCEETLRSIIADIDGAERTCYMEFYIWSEGGTADEVVEALIRAAGRGVDCRVMLDAAGSRAFLRGKLAQRLRQAGVELVGALPVGLLRMLFVRLDLRLHRKIVVIDGQIAYAGSLNLADSRYFKREAQVGEWIDSMVRLRGPAVDALEVTFLADLEWETGRGFEVLETAQATPTPARAGAALVQVVPSGPGRAPEAIHQMLLTTVYAARRELVMTTPYFVPDEAMHTALVSAALRGVEVTIVVPARIDSALVRLASRSHYDGLVAAGVRVMCFQAGLLHAKTITVDGEIGLIGSVNMDMRSFWLNFEVTLFVYDAIFGARLRETQERYIQNSEPVDLAQWRRRPAVQRFTENVVRLLEPLL